MVRGWGQGGEPKAGLYVATCLVTQQVTLLSGPFQVTAFLSGASLKGCLPTQCPSPYLQSSLPEQRCVPALTADAESGLALTHRWGRGGGFRELSLGKLNPGAQQPPSTLVKTSHCPPWLHCWSQLHQEASGQEVGSGRGHAHTYPCSRRCPPGRGSGLPRGSSQPDPGPRSECGLSGDSRVSGSLGQSVDVWPTLGRATDPHIFICLRGAAAPSAPRVTADHWESPGVRGVGHSLLFRKET